MKLISQEPIKKAITRYEDKIKVLEDKINTLKARLASLEGTQTETANTA